MNKTAVFIGRFQPLHLGHIEVLKRIREVTDRVVIVVGSSYAAPNIKNPFTGSQRADMLFPVQHELKFSMFEVVLVADNMYNNETWATSVAAAVEQRILSVDQEEFHEFLLVGAEKDASSFYLSTLFPQWEKMLLNVQLPINATDIRDEIFSSRDENGQMILAPHVRKLLPLSTAQYMYAFGTTTRYKELAKEYDFIKKYKEAWAAAPYPPTFVCTDAVVVCGGHILLVTRGAYPGKGLYALPGGFVNQDERIRDAIIRELIEETQIRVKKELLYSSLRQVRVFDHPGRSLRGRTITHAGLIILNNQQTLPRVKGSDDAAKCEWMPFTKFYKMSERLYEDHFDVANFMINRVS